MAHLDPFGAFGRGEKCRTQCDAADVAAAQLEAAREESNIDVVAQWRVGRQAAAPDCLTCLGMS